MAVFGLIGGTGLDHWGSATKTLVRETPFGEPSGPASFFRIGAHQLVFLPRHGTAHDIAPHRVNYRANLHFMRELNVSGVIAVNAVGGISERCAPGTLVIPDQLLDFTHGRESSFYDGVAGPLDHVEFAHPFSEDWQTRLGDAADAAGVPIERGACLAVTQGPRLETMGEIAMLRTLGGDLVGMTSMPEAALAREAGLSYVSLSVVSNWAAGVSDEVITMESIERTLKEAMNRVRSVIKAFMEIA